MNYFLGDLTKNLLPDGIGNAFPSGISHLMGQTANAGANVALTVEDKLAYDKTAKQVQLAYAEEDRATLSPFNINSSNTLLGSLVNQLVPYYSKLNSVGGVVSTIGSIVTGSLSRLSSVYADTDNRAQYTMCDDPAIKGKDIAAGPFCNIEYGIPPQYLDKDPEAVLNDLSSQINDTTGEPIDTSNALTSFDPTHDAKGSLKGWLDLCTDGTTSHAEDCKITDETTADYALYAIDHRIQKTMDGEDAALEGAGTSGSSTTDSSDDDSATTDSTDTDSTTDSTTVPSDTPTDTDTTTLPSAQVDTSSITSYIVGLLALLHSNKVQATASTPINTLANSIHLGQPTNNTFDVSRLFAYSLPPKKYEGVII